MVKLFLVFVFSINFSFANLFDFGAKRKEDESKITFLIEKIKKLEIKEGPEFEENFNNLVKAMEFTIEQKKLYCSGEAVDDSGKSISVGQSQFCMRELKNDYLNATQIIFEIKRKYLAIIHAKQIKKLNEIESSLKSDIDKNF